MSYTIWPCDCRMAMQYMDADSIDSVVCDPPYGLSKEPDAAEVLRHWLAGDDYTHGGSGFMGKSWDSFVPGPSVWREAYRVLKPGGHLVAFFGTRTYDLGVMALRLAGFEIRDQLAWVFGQGFPKSHDVSKGIDKLDAVQARRDRALKFTAWVREQGISPSQIDAVTETNMGGHYTTSASQPAVATRCHFERMRPMFRDVPPAWVEQMVDQRTVESENYAKRPVTQQGVGGASAGDVISFDQRSSTERERRDIPATPEAEQWEGWGTALKPAYEPIVLARKPLSERTVAANVLRWGTGALNIDGCRVGTEGGTFTPNGVKESKTVHAYGDGLGRRGAKTVEVEGLGRWPTNLAHDGSPEATAGMGDAQRYFYCPKASKADRNRGLEQHDPQPSAASQFRPNHAEKAAAGADGSPYGRWKPERNHHPTVKPTALMQWLCRMVTPPGGTVLDPFTGSGSTGVAAVLEGFDFVGCEMTEEYLPIIHARIDSAVISR
jgi:hypothetical protein